MKTLITNARIISPGVDIAGGSVLIVNNKIIAVLQPGETDGAQWATFQQVHDLISNQQICAVIAKQFLRQEPLLLCRQIAQE